MAASGKTRPTRSATGRIHATAPRFGYSVEPVVWAIERQRVAVQSTAGESDDQRYFTSLASKQRNIVGPALRTLDECLLRSALGRKPRGSSVFYEWAPLWSERATDLAQVRLQHAQAAAALAGAGLVDLGALGKAVVSQAEDDNWLPGLGQHVAAVTTREQPETPMEEDD
jgi:hypothetical protein